MDRRDRVAHLVHQTAIGAAHGRHDAELGGSRRRGLNRGLDERRDVEPRGAHRGVEATGLRAEVAVLGASARFDADDPLDLDVRTAPAHPHLVGECKRVAQPLVCEPQDVERLSLVEADSALEDLRPSHVEDVGGHLRRSSTSAPSVPAGNRGIDASKF